MKCLLLLVVLSMPAIAQLDSRVGQIAKRFKPSGRVEIREDITVAPSRIFAEYGNLFGLTTNDEMALVRADSNKRVNTRHLFQQYHKGVKVEGAEYIVHSRNGRSIRLNGKLASAIELDTRPQLTFSEAQNIVASQLPDGMTLTGESHSLSKQLNANDDSSKVVTKEEDPVITWLVDDVGLLPNNLALAYCFQASKGGDVYAYAIYADANTGKLLKIVPLFSSCVRMNDCYSSSCSSVTDSCATDLYGTRPVNSLYDSGVSKYKLYDNCRGVGIHTKEYVGGLSKEVLSTASTFTGHEFTVQAHWAAMKTFDYFCSTFDTKLMEGSGYEIRQLVNFATASQYVEKSFTSTQHRVTFGKAVLDTQPYCTVQVSVDIVAHEWTHAITDYSADLLSTNESEAGALNEGFSDIFGKMVEYYIDKEDDSLYTWSKFVMFSDVCQSQSESRRNLSNPLSSNQADVYGGYEWQGNSGKYSRSGVLLKWFYLLAMGGSGTNSHPQCAYAYDVDGITPEKAAKIAFYTLTTELTSTDGYAEAREGSIAVAIDEYGDSSPEHLAVVEAWNAVGVYSFNQDDVEACGDYHGSDEVRAVFRLQTCSPPPSANTIHATANVEYIAGTSIKLKPGFSAKNGSFFRASIQPCAGQLGKARWTNASVKPVVKSGEGMPESQPIQLLIVPNPVSGVVELRYRQYTQGEVEINITNTNGQSVLAIHHPNQGIGLHSEVLDLSALSPGIYYCSLRMGLANTNQMFVRMP